MLNAPTLSDADKEAILGGNLKDEWAYTLTSNGERQVYTKAGWYGQGEKDLDYTRTMVRSGLLKRKTLADRLRTMGLDAGHARLVAGRIERPITVKSSRSRVPMLPNSTSPQ